MSITYNIDYIVVSNSQTLEYTGGAFSNNFRMNDTIDIIPLQEKRII